VISTVTGWRALQTAPRGLVRSQISDLKSQILNPTACSLLPSHSEGTIRTSVSGFRAQRPTTRRPRIIAAPISRTTAPVRGEGFEPSSPDSKPGSLPLADPRFAKPSPLANERPALGPMHSTTHWHSQCHTPESALWESNPPRQLGRLEPLPLGQGHERKGVVSRQQGVVGNCCLPTFYTPVPTADCRFPTPFFSSPTPYCLLPSSQRKERELNPQGSSLGRFRDGCHRQLACPSSPIHLALI
jgi:hypothetical protein